MTISGFIAYVKQAWKNKPDTSTPITAERLTHLEDGVKMSSDAIEKIAAAVVSTITNDPNKIASMAALYSVNSKVTELNGNLPYKNLPAYSVPSGGAILDKVVAAYNAGYRCFLIYASGNVTDAPTSGYAQIRVTNKNTQYIFCEWLAENNINHYIATRMIDTSTMSWRGDWYIPLSIADYGYVRADVDNGQSYINIDIQSGNKLTVYKNGSKVGSVTLA